MIDFDLTVAVSDLINTALFAVTAVGVWFAHKQLRLASVAQKATFFKDLYTTLYHDPEIRRAFYLVEYSEFSYSETFHGSEQEQLIDRLLSFMDLICRLHQQGALDEVEMNTFKYEILRVFDDDDIQEYFGFLDEWYQQNLTGTKPFAHLRAYGVRHRDTPSER